MRRAVLFILCICLFSMTCYTQSKESILDKAALSVAQLKTDAIIGHGVCVSGKLLVCPISTMGKYSYGQARLYNGKTCNITGFTFADNDNDFVLLRLDYDSARPIPMADYAPVIGQKVFLCVENASGSIELKEGRLRDSKDFGAVKLIQLDASSQFRSPGLPVLDSLGNMIGLSVNSPIEDPGSNFAIPVELIKKAMAAEENFRKLDMLQPFFENLKQISFAGKVKSKAVSDFLEQGIDKLNKKDYKGAIEKFNMAIRVSPVDADAYAFRGQAKSMLMQYKDALPDFNKALELQPDYAEVLDMRGVCKAELGDMAGACEDWKLSFRNGYNPAFKLLEKYCDLE